MSDTAPRKAQRDGGVDCTAPLATAGSDKPSKAGTTWLGAELAVPG